MVESDTPFPRMHAIKELKVMVGPAMYNGGYLESLQIRITQGHGIMPYRNVGACTHKHTRAGASAYNDRCSWLSIDTHEDMLVGIPASVLDFKEIPVG